MDKRKGLSMIWTPDEIRRFAVVKYGAGIVDMSGSIGGTTFSRNRGGKYARARTKPVNPNSARQVRMKAIIATLTEEWIGVLTGANRTAWNDYAAGVNWNNALGETINLSGFNMFIRSNAVILDMAATQVNAGPVLLTLPDQDPLMAVTASEATQQFEVTFDDGLAWCSEDDAYMYFLFGQPQNPTRNFFNGPWRGYRFLSGDVGAPIASPQVLGAIINISETQKAWVKARIVRADGRMSHDFTAFCTVAA